jgi:hypothetical protein
MRWSCSNITSQRHHARIRVLLIVAAALVCGTASHLNAQWIRASGSLGASADVYRPLGTTSRLPTQSYRVAGRLQLTVFDQIVLPFELFLNSGRLGYQQPFNQFGVTPRFGSVVQLFAGWYSTRISDLTVGDSRILGGGVELSPGPLRLALHYGYTRQPVQPDTSRAFGGEYRRRLLAGKLGIEWSDGSFLALQCMSSRDEPGSIHRDSLTPAPQANVVASVAGGLGALNGAVRIRGELALGLFTRNTEAQADSARFQDLPQPIRQLLPINSSSNADGAVRLSFNLTPSPDWGISLDGQWIGPGFVTLGYAQLLNDILDLNASPYVRLAGGKLLLRGSIGRRTNNLRQTRIATVERWNASAGVNWQITDDIGADVQYSRYTMSSDHANDTLRMDNQLNSVTVAPRWKFRAFDADNMLTAALSWQETTDHNRVTGQFGSNSAMMVNVSHNVTFPSQVNLTTSLSLNRTSNYLQKLTMATFNEAITYPLIAQVLRAQGNVGINLTSAQRTTAQVLLRAALTYTPGNYGSFTLQVMNNTFDLTRQQGNTYSELFASLQYSVGF